MMLRALLVVTVCGLVAGGTVTEGNFILQPQDATVQAGDVVRLDCELVVGDTSDICAWKISGTSLGVDHFYNVDPPSKVRALFPDHERVCSIVIDDADWRHSGYWTCWPLGDESHVSSRAALVTVSGGSTTDHTTMPTTTQPTTIQPSSTQPTTTQPTTIQPSSTQPTTTQPTTIQPSSTQPTTTQPTTIQPSSTQPTTTQPTTIQPSSTQPTTTQPTTIQPTTTQPTTTQRTTTTPSTPPVAPTVSPAPGFSCPQDGLFPDPVSDRYYYYCKDGTAVHMQCEFPLTWDDTQKNCS